MGTTTNLGIEYPDPSGVPSRQSWVEDPIKSVDEKVVEYLHKRVKGGTIGVSVTSLAQGTGDGPFAVTFATPFDSTPSVVVSSMSAPAGSSYLVPRVVGATASGFNVYVYNVGPAAATASLTVGWHATDLGDS